MSDLTPSESPPTDVPIRRALEGENAFCALRLALAALVVCSHAFPLGGFGEDPLLLLGGWQESLGGVAVDSFFALSGYLVFGSWSRSQSVRDFLWRRALRILPPYWCCLAAIAFGFAPLFRWLEGGALDASLLIGPEGSLAFIRKNALLLVGQKGIAGLLSGVPFPDAIDASLWTIPYEAGCYVALALLGYLGGLRGQRPAVLDFAFFGLWLLYAVEEARPALGTSIIGNLGDASLLRLCAFFAAGAWFFARRDVIPIRGSLFRSCCAALVVTQWHGGGFALVSVVAIPYAVLWLGARLPRALRGWRRDLSYGLYLYAFPVQQLAALLGVHHHGFTAYLAVSLVGGLALAAASHALIESRLSAVAAVWRLEPAPTLGARGPRQ